MAKIDYPNGAELKAWLIEGGRNDLAARKSFEIDTVALDVAEEEVKKQHPELNEADAEARAAYRLVVVANPVVVESSKTQTAYSSSQPNITFSSPSFDFSSALNWAKVIAIELLAIISLLAILAGRVR